MSATASSTDFTHIALNGLRQGNALQIHPTTDTNVFIRYYLDTASQSLRRTASGTGQVQVLAPYLTNQIAFVAEDFAGHTLTNDQNNRVIKMVLDFYQWEFPVARAGAGLSTTLIICKPGSPAGRSSSRPRRRESFMKTNPARNRKSQDGYALLLVMVLAAASILIYSSAANWTSTSAGLNDRNNTYNRAVAAAEAATEVVLGYMTRDFFNQSFDPTRLSYYGSFIPTTDWAAAYQFTDGAGGAQLDLGFQLRPTW